MSKKDKTLTQAIEFQPDALEIKQSRLPFFARFTPYAAFVMMAGAIIWATIGKTDTVVQAPGKLVSDEHNIMMKPREITVIKKVHVEEGDIVKANQILMTFDPENYKSEQERLESEISTLEAQFDRLFAEFNQKAYAPKKQTRDTLWQLEIHKQRMAYYKERMNYFAQELARINAAIRTRTQSLKNSESRLKEFRPLEKMYQDLGDVVATKRERIEISVKRMELEATTDELRNTLDELEHQKQSSVASRKAFDEEWRNGISTEMIKIRRELIANKKQLEKTANMAQYIYLRSPCEAMIHEIAAVSPGSAVREAEPLITLVPLNGKIELEAEVSPQDIGKVAVGDSVRIKLNAYPFQKYGTLEGKVTHLSKNTFGRQQGSPLPPDGSITYYKATITVEGKLRNVDEKYRLIPGMEVQAEIKVGKRRIIEYILYPLIKALDESAREP